MLFSILILAVIVYISWRIAPRERQEDAHVHGAGQVGLLAAVALIHVIGALRHHIFKRNDVLRRMTWGTHT